MRPFAFDTWVGVGTAVAALALLSVVLLPAGLALKGLGLLLAPQARRAGSGRVGRRLRRAAREARALRDVRPRDGEHRPLPALAS